MGTENYWGLLILLLMSVLLIVFLLLLNRRLTEDNDMLRKSLGETIQNNLQLNERISLMKSQSRSSTNGEPGL